MNGQRYAVHAEVYRYPVAVELHDVAATMHGFDNALEATITRNCVSNRVRFMKSLMG